MNIDDLSEDLAERAAAIAVARDESVDEILDRFDREAIRVAPKSFSKHIPSLREARFEEVGVEGDLAYVVLMDGTKLYGYLSEPYHEKIHGYVADQLSPKITPQTFLTALDVTHRVLTDTAWPAREIMIPSDGVVVECGAYLGHKTIRFAREVVPKGRVIAIEMMPDNVRVLRRNVESNGLADRIEVVETGVWNERQQIPVTGMGRQRNTIAGLERLTDETGVVAEVRRLEDILGDTPGIEFVDLLFVTVNGAEVEALEGLGRWTERVGCAFVAAPYSTRGERPNAEVVREILESRGFSIRPKDRPSRVVGIRSSD